MESTSPSSPQRPVTRSQSTAQREREEPPAPGGLESGSEQRSDILERENFEGDLENEGDSDRTPGGTQRLTVESPASPSSVPLQEAAAPTTPTSVPHGEPTADEREIAILRATILNNIQMLSDADSYPPNAMFFLRLALRALEDPSEETASAKLASAAREMKRYDKVMDNFLGQDAGPSRRYTPAAPATPPAPIGPEVGSEQNSDILECGNLEDELENDGDSDRTPGRMQRPTVDSPTSPFSVPPQEAAAPNTPMSVPHGEPTADEREIAILRATILNNIQMLSDADSYPPKAMFFLRLALRALEDPSEETASAKLASAARHMERYENALDNFSGQDTGPSRRYTPAAPATPPVNGVNPENEEYNEAKENTLSTTIRQHAMLQCKTFAGGLFVGYFSEEEGQKTASSCICFDSHTTESFMDTEVALFLAREGILRSGNTLCEPIWAQCLGKPAAATRTAFVALSFTAHGKPTVLRFLVGDVDGAVVIGIKDMAEQGIEITSDSFVRKYPGNEETWPLFLERLQASHHAIGIKSKFNPFGLNALHR